MAKSYIAISVIIFTLVAIGHVARIPAGVAGAGRRDGSCNVRVVGRAVVSVALAVWGAMLLRR